jgi:tRNA G18 (ribose-2'-O)-methylase SpoU
VASVPIDDRDDPRLADYLGVSDPELAGRCGIFIAEGRLVVRRLLAGRRFGVRSVMVTETAHAGLADALSGVGAPPIYVVPQALMNGLAGFNVHRGCLAIGERRPDADWRELSAAAARLVVLERVGNADNVGSVFRSAAAFGAGAVLLGPACADPLYRKAIRTSMGAVLAVPFASVDAWPDALHDMRRAGVVVLGLTPAATAAPLREVAASLTDRRIALVLGHEGDGLTAGALHACDAHACIPVASGVDSLNLAAAAAIGLYETRRPQGPGLRAQQPQEPQTDPRLDDR